MTERNYREGNRDLRLNTVYRIQLCSFEKNGFDFHFANPKDGIRPLPNKREVLSHLHLPLEIVRPRRYSKISNEAL